MKLKLLLFEEHVLHTIDEEGDKFFRNSKVGKAFEVECKEIRNCKMHKKLFTLFDMIHDILPEPKPVEFMGKMIAPEHTKENTRKFLTVQAGYYTVNGYPNGKVRVEADSISFANMKQDEFEKLYSNVIDVALKVIPDTWTQEDIIKTANEIINYS